MRGNVHDSVDDLEKWCASSDENANWVLSITRPADVDGNIQEGKKLLRDGLAVSTVAERVGFSFATNFSKSFAKRVGCSPTQWMEKHRLRLTREERVEQAQLLLVTGEHNVTDIAKMVGFNSPQALTMAFKAIHGVSATAWVARCRERVTIEVMAIPTTHKKKPKN